MVMKNLKVKDSGKDNQLLRSSFLFIYEFLLQAVIDSEGVKIGKNVSCLEIEVFTVNHF